MVTVVTSRFLESADLPWFQAVTTFDRGVTTCSENKVVTMAKQSAKPFTREEIHKIMEAFKGNYYENFVRFLLGVGCRTGEAIALEWSAINDDCSEVWIGKAWDSKGKRVKSTKTNETRTVPISPGVQKMLQDLREQSKSKLVFPAPKGGYIG